MTNVATSLYRHGALACVHQVELAPLRPSSIQVAPALDVRSFDLLFPVQPRQSPRSYPQPSAICFAIADLVIAAADPFSLVRSDLAAVVVGSVGFAAGSAVAVVVAAAAGLSVAVDSAATVFVVAGPDSAVAADLVCFSGSVCFFAVGMAKGKAVVVISCFLTPRSSF